MPICRGHSRICLALMFLLIAVCWSQISLAASSGRRVQDSSVDNAPVWVYFSDKGLRSATEKANALKAVQDGMSERSLRRRLNRGLIESVTMEDVPVCEEYLRAVRSLKGVKTRVISRWLNAVSVCADAAALQQIRRLRFVDRIEPVRRFYRQVDPVEQGIRWDQEDPQPPAPRRDHAHDYGGSLLQNSFLNVPSLHDLDLTGEGILVGLMDAGFNNLDHNCFQDLNLVAAWDFLNDNDNVADQEDDLGVGEHGTKTLSIIAGYEAGRMIGTAFGAGYVLAKTECSVWERPVEEDYWVAAVEWMDELGVEVASSSLTYMDWYEYEDMDGATGVTTIAAEHAIDRGMVIVVSMGNTGQNNYPRDKMGAPADGMRVYGIGAVNRDSTLAAFSSRGPTFDGRIKPDFTTMGSSVRFASDRDDVNYGAGLGTSFSAPALAGLCALLLEADSYLTPISLRELLRSVSHNNEEPDTALGWGIPDGLEAWRNLAFPDDPLVVSLAQGWNTISSNRRSAQIDVTQIFNPLVERGTLIIVKNGQGQFFNPEFQFNNIPMWKQDEGYQICVTRAEEVVFEGAAVNYTEPMLLEEGWQIVAFFPDFPMTAEVAFSSLVANETLVLVKDDQGRFFIPEFDFNGMDLCRPGKGYQLLTTEETTLIYPRQRQWEADTSPRILTPSHYPIPNRLEVYNSSLLALAGEGVEDGDELAFFDPDGDLVGAAVFSEGKAGVAIWGGDIESPMPEPRLFSRRLGWELQPAIKLLSGDECYKPNGITVCEVRLNELHQPPPADLFLEAAPNPFNNQITIRYSALETVFSIAIFDATGRLMMYESRQVNEGTVIFDAAGWPSGAYIVRAKNARGQVERSIQLIR